MTLQAQLAAAKPGASIVLTGSSQGDVVLSGLKFPAAPVTVVGLVCRTLRLVNCQGLHFIAPAVTFTPDMTAGSNSAGVYMSGCADVVIAEGGKIIGGPSVNGVAETATALIASGPGNGNVIGRPCGYGVNILHSSFCQVTDTEIAQFDRGVVMDAVSDILLARNDIHDRRRTGIMGANVNRLTVDGNLIRNAKPWRAGQTPVGDHVDCMAFWSDAGQTTANDEVRIVNNLMEQLSGDNLLGLWFNSASGANAAPFTNFEISGNTFLLPNEQGIALWGSKNGLIARNTLIVADAPWRDPKQRPTILLRANCDGVAIRDNRVSNPISDLSGGANPQSGNVLLTGQVAGS